eukprot:TRINITY_DN56391_c0_g1_i1.p3 TRINITY_DN56391_c0_g1~~TRINITY_DN56391_c0_g1_i1.p3  ORF type:complete len:116 (-),score=15.22 TRINITY_DN56391_c0_g1_i1:30-377(-)
MASGVNMRGSHSAVPFPGSAWFMHSGSLPWQGIGASRWTADRVTPIPEIAWTWISAPKWEPSLVAQVLLVSVKPVSYTHLRAHETPEHLVCRLLLEKKKTDGYQLLFEIIPGNRY